MRFPLQPEDVERWLDYLTPGIKKNFTPTQHSERELLRELLLEQKAAADLSAQLNEAKCEVRGADNAVDNAVEELCDTIMEKDRTILHLKNLARAIKTTLKEFDS